MPCGRIWPNWHGGSTGARRGQRVAGDRCAGWGSRLRSMLRQPDRAGGAAQAVQTMIGSIEKRVVRQHRSNEESKRLETIPGSAFSGPPRSQRPSPIRMFFDRAETSPHGLGSCHDKIRPAASRSLGRSRNRAIATCVASWSLEPVPSCGGHASSRRSIPGSYSFSPGDRSRSLRSRLPTRWRASPGRCWLREGPTERLA